MSQLGMVEGKQVSRPRLYSHSQSWIHSNGTTQGAVDQTFWVVEEVLGGHCELW